MANSIAATYKIPDEIMGFVDDGFLEIRAQDEDKRTVELEIPSLWTSASSDNFTSYTLIWIHPDHNAEFCHCYLDNPGDLPNFYVRIHSPETSDKQVDDLNTVDDLIAWLADAEERSRARS